MLRVQLVKSSGAIELMVKRIAVAQKALQGAPVDDRDTPKWITPMLLFIDLYGKVVLARKRRDSMASICSAGKWKGYQPDNKILEGIFVDKKLWEVMIDLRQVKF